MNDRNRGMRKFSSGLWHGEPETFEPEVLRSFDAKKSELFGSLAEHQAISG